MTEQPYHHGAQQPCLICRQSREIKETVKTMACSHTYGEIAEWLGTQGIKASNSQVRTFLVKSNVPSRIRTIQPTGTYTDRLGKYVTELLKHNHQTYTIHNLGLKGPKWTTVSAKLHKSGLISPMREYTPIRWKIVATKDEIKEWYESEIKRIKEKEHPPIGERP